MEEKPTAFVEQRLLSKLVIDKWDANLHKHSPRERDRGRRWSICREKK